MSLDLTAATEIPLFVLTLIVIAFFGKLVGAGLPACLLGYTRRESLAVGVGMNARGAVELIIAEIALRAGIFNHPAPLPPFCRAPVLVRGTDGSGHHAPHPAIAAADPLGLYQGWLPG